EHSAIIIDFEFYILHWRSLNWLLREQAHFATPIQEGLLVACTKLRRKTPFAQRMFFVFIPLSRASTARG
ncbi:MAG: hypothetical protein IIU62_03745, partial [Alistipes sp.]|nr:hypothetical protein [Alistipes sp.]